jgi:hypothetical protein
MKGGTQPIYSFAGGPEHYGIHLGFNGNGNLISRSGPWGGKTQDYTKVGGHWDGSGIVLVDDDSSAQSWIDKFNQFEQEMNDTTYANYDPLANGFQSVLGLLLPDHDGNSNSWARELLERAGLLGQYKRAMIKRSRGVFGHKQTRSPWTPGWVRDPWGDD